MFDVVVYSKSQCVQCEQTKKYLDVKNIPYKVINIEEDQVALQKVLDMGYKSAPVVTIYGDDFRDSWSGFRLNNLSQLADNFNK